MYMILYLCHKRHTDYHIPTCQAMMGQMNVVPVLGARAYERGGVNKQQTHNNHKRQIKNTHNNNHTQQINT